ncbi:MAG: diguanylate cyclase [Candidatus Riflebacteria bacterium]|nr:diguanylate cyclase [Candidatus Riflebacteria bacterium]
MKIILKDQNGNILNARELKAGMEDLKIGRAASCDISLNSLSISRQHLHLQVDKENRVWIQDLQSTFGTIVNGQKIIPGVKIPINDGFVIQLSEEVFLFLDMESRETDSPVPSEQSTKECQSSDIFPFFLDRNMRFVKQSFSDIQQLVPDQPSAKLAVIEEKVTSKIRELSAILEVSFALNAINNYQRLLEYTIDMALKVTNAERGAIVLYHEPQQKFETVVARRMGHNEVSREMETSQSMILRCFQTDQTIVVANTEIDPSLAQNKSIVINKIKCVAATPLKLNNAAIGVLYLDSRLSSNMFQDGLKDLLRVFAAQASVAIYNSRLLHMATTDGLTNLINHRSYMQRLIEEFYRAKRHQLPLSVVMMDIDHFKKINDTFGHPVGDKALRIVSTILRQHVRVHDVAARYGGEEFALLLPQTDLEGARVLAEKIRQMIERASLTLEDKQVLRCNISAGVAQLDGITMDKPMTLIQCADKALYQAKEDGRNRVVCAPSSL